MTIKRFIFPAEVLTRRAQNRSFSLGAGQEIIMRASTSIALVLAALALAACDNVRIPGADSRPSEVERETPPPPSGPVAPEETATPTPTGSEETSTPAPTDTSAAVEDPATEDPTPELPEAEGPASDETTSDDDATEVPASTEEPVDPPAPVESPYASVSDLLSINAARCAPTTEESRTLAQLANATRATDGSFSAQAVNGTQVSTAAFPGIVKMEPKRRLENGGISSGHCGATRISKNWFITASHCLDETYDDVDLISTEASLLDPRAVRVQANSTICHSAYGGATGRYANDVALVSVSDEVAETEFADVPIARFGATDEPLGALNYPQARMAGWGITSFDGGDLSNDLLTTTLTMVSSGPAEITVASLNDAGPCIGDSGGPLMIDEADGEPRVIGVLSVVEQNRLTGEFCKGTYNARYTNLQGFTGWIEDVIGVCQASPELCAR